MHLFKSSFLREIYLSLQEKTVNKYPFAFIAFEYNKTGLEKLENKFPTLLHKKSKTELGRSKIYLHELRDNDINCWKLWESILNDDDTKFLVNHLTKKLNADSKFKKSKWRGRRQKLFRSLIPRKIVSQLESLSNSKFNKGKKSKLGFIYFSLIKCLGLIGYYDDATIEISGSLPLESIRWNWQFVTDFDCQLGLPPHTDSPQKVLTMLIPISASPTFRPGTTILTSSANVANWDSSRYPYCLFKEYFTSPHRLGFGLTFSKGSNSWHTVKKGYFLPPGEDRKTLILTAYSTLENRHAVD